MKLLIVTNMYPSVGDESWRGGFVKDQVEELRKEVPSMEIDIFHIKAKICGGSNLSYLTSFFKLTNKILFERYDLIHSHHAFCTLLCMFGFRRLIYTIHEGELNNKPIRSFLIKLASKISRASIYVSREEYNKSKKTNRFFLPCGVNLNTFKPSQNKIFARNKLGLPPSIPLILFPADPGRPEKNAFLLKDMENIAALSGKNWRFIYGGKIEKDSMPCHIQAADIVISIGRYESDGMVVKESMACNTPVISTRVGNSPFYIKPDNGLLISPNTDELFKATEEILGSPSKFSNGRATLISLDQSIEKVSNKLYQIYQSQLH
ncbi:MAG: glycosyltransferase family 4 protein [Desulfurococcaceae archaeon]